MTADGFIDQGINHGKKVCVKTYSFCPKPSVTYDSIWAFRVLLSLKIIIKLAVKPFELFSDNSYPIILRDWAFYIALANYAISSFDISKNYNFILVGMLILRLIKQCFTLSKTDCFEYCLERQEFLNNNCEMASVILGQTTTLIGTDLFLSLKDFGSTLNYSELVSVCSGLHIIPESLPVKGKFRFIRFINNQEENRCLYSALEGFNIFKPLHYTLYGKNHPLNHVSTSPFPGSTKVSPLKIMISVDDVYYKSWQDTIPSRNLEEKLPGLNFNDRMKAMNRFVDKRPESNNRERLRLYLRNCVQWYHGRNYKKTATLEYRTRWQNHVSWILGSDIVETKISYFKKIDIPVTYVETQNDLSRTCMEPPKLSEHLEFVKEGKSRNENLFDNLIITRYNEDVEVTETKKGMLLHKPLEKTVKAVENPNSLDKKKRPKIEFRGPCDCGAVCKFTPVRMGAGRLKSIKEDGEIDVIDLEPKSEEKTWEVVVRKSNQKAKRLFNESPFRNFYSVLSNVKGEDEKIPHDLNPFPKDYLNEMNEYKSVKKCKNNTKKRIKTAKKVARNQNPRESDILSRKFPKEEPSVLSIEDAMRVKFNEKERENKFHFENFFRTSVFRHKDVSRVYKYNKLGSLGSIPEFNVHKCPSVIIIKEGEITDLS